MIVCKFGGSSVADISTAKNIKTIINMNDNRRFIIVSALGKNSRFHKKVTDELYECFFIYQYNKQTAKKLFLKVVEKYENLANDLNIKLNLVHIKLEISNCIDEGKITKEYLVSRGEYLSALIYAKYLNIEFLDAKDYIIFNKNGVFNYKATQKRLKSLDVTKKYCIGGFYGATKSGEIKIFSRGGSDITGAIVAKALNCELYENYTDVNGVYNKNPNIFTGAINLPFLNYKTACQMAEAGNEVVHKTALFLLKDTNTILIVKNTKNPNTFGTVLVCSDYLFNDIYLCVANLTVIKTKYVTKDTLQNLKHCAEIKKVILDNDFYYILISELYITKDKIYSIVDAEYVCDANLFSIFCNVKLNKKRIKILTKIQKILKNKAFFAKFLSFNNNFIILCNKENAKDIVLILNKHLQK